MVFVIPPKNRPQFGGNVRDMILTNANCSKCPASNVGNQGNRPNHAGH